MKVNEKEEKKLKKHMEGEEDLLSEKKQRKMQTIKSERIKVSRKKNRFWIADARVNLPGDDAGNEDDEDEEDEEEYGDAPTVGYQESELNFGDFVRRFISEKTLQICGILLEKFETNSVHTNHCIVKLLHRIAVDCGMPAMLFQASLFRIFQRAMSSPNPEHKVCKTILF
ncbi:hypothetical protein LSTR_LSTR015022 [Laodelphax striatellus]|uniref:Uncharacterized protein n=1 Tax=Laodelphax striatellus TaxID=195883 RepID=A0A482X4N1_LAOST|nr:hypothetical protein LSTR_LSTR015022 [Laodelphax striatellus]